RAALQLPTSNNAQRLNGLRFRKLDDPNLHERRDKLMAQIIFKSTEHRKQLTADAKKLLLKNEMLVAKEDNKTEKLEERERVNLTEWLKGITETKLVHTKINTSGLKEITELKQNKMYRTKSLEMFFDLRDLVDSVCQKHASPMYHESQPDNWQQTLTTTTGLTDNYRSLCVTLGWIPKEWNWRCRLCSRHEALDTNNALRKDMEEFVGGLATKKGKSQRHLAMLRQAIIDNVHNCVACTKTIDRSLISVPQVHNNCGVLKDYVTRTITWQKAEDDEFRYWRDPVNKDRSDYYKPSEFNGYVVPDDCQPITPQKMGGPKGLNEKERHRARELYSNKATLIEEDGGPTEKKPK
ncbi:MAG: hypothetical protein SGARI_000591, partial [Bacillariaceae sp.]